MATKKKAPGAGKPKGIHLVKRKGHLERYDDRKIYASVYAACLAGHRHERDAERIAGAVAKNVTSWINTQKSVTSSDIFRQVIHYLNEHDKEIAFLYETHLDVS